MNVLIHGIVLPERDPCCEIINLSAEVKDSEDKAMRKLVKKALKDSHKSIGTNDYPYEHSLAHNIPFTGTIDAEVTIYYGDE